MTKVKELLDRAAAKSNDSSEEKHITKFLDELFEDTEVPKEIDRIDNIRVSATQMKEFCEMVEQAAEEDIEDLRTKEPPPKNHRVELIFSFGIMSDLLVPVPTTLFSIPDACYQRLLKNPPIVDAWIITQPIIMDLAQYAHEVRIKVGPRVIVWKHRTSNEKTPYVEK